MINGENPDGMIIEYSGSAIHVSAFVQALTDEGLQVHYDRPPARAEQRGVPDPAAFEHAYVLIEAWASSHPITTEVATGAVVTSGLRVRTKVDAAIKRWRSGRLARAAEVHVKDGPRHKAD